MKRKIILLFPIALTLSACNILVDNSEPVSELSMQLESEYDFYSDSVKRLKNKMEVNTDQANEIFQILVDCGANDEINYVFEKDGYFDVWAGLKKLKVYMASDGTVEKVTDSREQLYPRKSYDDFEPNTSPMVDYILIQAKNDAENVTEEDADAKLEEALNYLSEHMDNFYESNDVMEKSMYYGEYVYRYIQKSSNTSNISQLTPSEKIIYDAGYNTVKAIKYVYRGAESIEDEATQNALNKAFENLSAIE